MKGKHKIVVQNKNLHYEFEIKRNITIIQGDSATGKTTLIDMLRTHDSLGDGSGISVSSDVPCKILEGRDWKLILSNYSGVIFFTDEENTFVQTEEFAHAVKNSDNYFVIITRENLYLLPISVDEIYGMHSSGKYQNTRRVYQELYHIYSHEDSYPITPEKIITEDSNSGYQFFNEICKQHNLECISAEGNANIFKLLSSVNSEETCIIADGAAFGAHMNRIFQNIKNKQNVHLYLPESFEWIILKTGLIDKSKVADMLAHTEDYADSKEFMSWEQFYTATLISQSQNTYLQYSKIRLNPAYLHTATIKKILDVIKGIKF
jgi:hypothetical protein